MLNLCCTTAFALALAAFGAAQDPAIQARERLRGTWAITHMKAKKAVAEDYRARGKVIFRGDRMLIQLGDDVLADHHLKLDPAGHPKRIQATHADGPYKGLTWSGIYELEGDTLRLLFAPPGKAPPAAWPTKGTQLKKVVVLKRTGQ
jgi:uncharacterized protein (TIGR03067 family)